jgi:hypothetical protein
MPDIQKKIESHTDLESVVQNQKDQEDEVLSGSTTSPPHSQAPVSIVSAVAVHEQLAVRTQILDGQVVHPVDGNTDSTMIHVTPYFY